MRPTGTSAVLKPQAIAGSSVIVLAWDLVSGQEADLAGCLGFAIERTEFHQTSAVVESYWMRSIKRFKDKNKGLPPGTPVSTAEHPIQSFQWGDERAHAGRTYQYRIVPTRGTPKLLTLDHAAGVTVDVQTEPESGTLAAAAGEIRHDIYFNRGVIGAQAFAREFQNAEPDPDDPTSPEMVWLSRGRFDALQHLIGLAKNENFALRAAFNEFRNQAVVAANQPTQHSFAKHRVDQCSPKQRICSRKHTRFGSCRPLFHMTIRTLEPTWLALIAGLNG